MSHSLAGAGRIGPNAITRVAQALPPRVGSRAARDIFERAGLAHYLQQPPLAMVDEAEVRALHAELRASLGTAEAAAVARAAGLATGAYLLQHRIPRPAQWLLKGLPAGLAARALLAALRRNAWTFAGSGHFEAQCRRAADRASPQVRLQLQANPLCQGQSSLVPVCDFYAATFEHLFRALVHPQAQVREVACEACGDAACVFELRWPARAPGPGRQQPASLEGAGT
jgi:divinyl protochlorophyllide a 8-vinyl-reductase